MTVPAGGHVSVTFPGIALTTPVPVEVKALVTDVAPDEYDATNDTRSATVDVTASQLASPYRVLFPSLVGYGAQFGDHVYAPITPWPPGQDHADVEAKVKALEPQLVRIFYNDNWDANANGKFPDYATNYASFVQVVQLAQDTGATIEISFQNLGNILTGPAGPPMAKFADVLQDLVVNHGLTNVRWVEVGNEPNSGSVTFDQYNALYRALNAELIARGLRSQIQLMGAGLVENGVGVRDHYSWLSQMGANMNDILDGYAEHVYWFYYDSGRLEYRLRDSVHALDALPADQQKPLYMMEFGIRANDTCGTKPAFKYLYYAADPDVSGDLADEHRRLPAVLVQRRLGAARRGRDVEVGRLLEPVRQQQRHQPAPLDDRAADGRLPADPDLLRHVAALPHDGAGLADRRRRSVGLERLVGSGVSPEPGRHHRATSPNRSSRRTPARPAS